MNTDMTTITPMKDDEIEALIMLHMKEDDEIEALVESMGRVLDEMESQGVHCDPALQQKLDAIEGTIDRKIMQAGKRRPLYTYGHQVTNKVLEAWRKRGVDPQNASRPPEKPQERFS